MECVALSDTLQQVTPDEWLPGVEEGGGERLTVETAAGVDSSALLLR